MRPGGLKVGAQVWEGCSKSISPEFSELSKCSAFSSRNLASFKLSYVSPENDKIGKNGVVEVGEKKWSLEAKNGLREFFVEWKLMFWGRSLIWKGQKIRYLRKRAENGRKDFLKKFGRSRKSIQFGKLDQKSLFFIWFFIDNGQKTYEKIRKNWI